MKASLTWLDLTASDRDKARRVFDLLEESGTVDELGLGSLRDAFSDALFPGTSTLFTRLRYFLFIPWIYQELGRKAAGSDIAERARAAEIEIIKGLVNGGESEGVIGIEARDQLNRLPSNVYWAGLVKWGLFLPEKSQGWYHTHFDAPVGKKRAPARSDDSGVEEGRTWHPRLPGSPEGFPQTVNFALTREEAEFLLGRIETQAPDSMLAWLAREGEGAPAKVMWEDPVALDSRSAAGDTFELARRFSRVMEGAPLFYNLLLAERRYELEKSEDDLQLIDDYKAEFSEWASEAEPDLIDFPLNELWAFAARAGVRQALPQQEFIKRWIGDMAKLGGSGALESAELRGLIERRERSLKAGRARLANKGRLLDWSGRVGTGRMVFRWPQVRQLLIDLREGLDS